MRNLFAALLGLALTTGAAGADVLQQITERGAMRLGFRADAPPFSYAGPGGVASGLAVRLCEAVAERIANQLGLPGMDIEYVEVRANERFEALVEGRTDLHCGPASATLERRQTLDFSILYFVDGAAAAVRPGTYETIFDNRMGTFGYLDGTTTEAVVRDLVERNAITADLVSFPSHSEGLLALAEGKVDVYFADQAILLFQIDEQNLADRIEVMEEVFSFEPYALALKRGETSLRLAVDTALSAIYDSSLIYRMIVDELGNYPLPPETRALYQIVGLPE